MSNFKTVFQPKNKAEYTQGAFHRIRFYTKTRKMSKGQSISYDQNPTSSSLYTIQSAKFAIEAKNYVRLHWTPLLKSKEKNQKDARPYIRKITTCFPFISRFNNRDRMHQNEIPQTEIVLQELFGESSILYPKVIQALSDELPAGAIGFPWRLTFCSSRDGFNLHNLYRKLSHSDSPVLLVIEDLANRVFGGLSSSAIRISEQYFGTNECFLYTCHPEFKVYKWNRDNTCFVKAREDSLAFGCGFGRPGLWFDSNLNKGRTERCLTYGNKPLVPDLDFIIKNLECWTFG